MDTLTPMRLVSLLLALVLLALLAEPACAQQRPLDTATAIAEIRKASEAGDEDRLRELARMEVPDAWWLAEQLLHEGHAEPARRLVELAHPVDVARLPAYLDAVVKDGHDEVALRHHKAFAETYRAEGLRTALPHLETFDGPLTSVPAIHLTFVYARVLFQSGDPRGALAQLERAAEAAEAIGWLAHTTTILRRAIITAEAAGDTPTMTRYALEAVRVARLRQRDDVVRTDETNLAGAHLSAGRYDEAGTLLDRLEPEFRAAGATREAAYALMSRGLLASHRGNYGVAIARYRQAHRELLAIDDRPMAGRLLSNLGTTLADAGRLTEAAETMTRARDEFRELGDAAGIARVEANLSGVLRRLGRSGEALELGIATVERARRGGSQAELAEALLALGVTYHRLGDAQASRTHNVEALRIRLELRSLPEVLTLLGNVSFLSRTPTEVEEADLLHVAALERFRGHAAPLELAQLHDKAAFHHAAQFERDEALAHDDQATALRREHGKPIDVARTHVTRGHLHQQLVEHREAITSFDRALEGLEGVAGDNELALLQQSKGAAHLELGEYDAAEAACRVALELARGAEDSSLVCTLLDNLAHIAYERGQIASSLNLAEEGLALARRIGDDRAVAEFLAQLGSTLHRAGDFERALELHLEATAAYERLGSTRDALMSSRNAAVVLADLGRTDEAAARARKVHDQAVRSGNTRVELVAASSLATHAFETGRTDEARPLLERSLELAESLGDAVSSALARTNLGRLEWKEGRHEAARASLEQALEEWSAIGHAAGETSALVALARFEVDAGNAARAVELVDDGIARLPLLTGALADEEVARARGRWYSLYELGFHAAGTLDDAGGLLRYAEGARATGLLRALGGDDAAVTGPATAQDDRLLAAEAQARSDLEAARARAAAAIRSRKLKEAREARKAVEEAEGTLLDAVAAVQRRSRGAAAVRSTEPVALKTLQRALATDQALVLHMEVFGRVHALVITRKTFHVAELGPADELRVAVEAVTTGDPRTDLTDATRRLRKFLVEPLGLADDVQHVIVSPSAATAYAPLPLLHPDLRVSATPSGTTLSRLSAGTARAGKHILSLGDPAYDRDTGASSATSEHRGGLLPSRLPRLPGTADEAKAIGDVVLLAEEATESGLLSALTQEKRWRAIHLACHGLIDVERPLLSGLALTPGDGEDGLLTCLDLLRAELAADLVVLSACETGRGRVYRAEGVVGLTGSILAGGGERVIASLWKVDDRATQALMTRFYELWNPKRGKGLPAPEALRQAQEHIRSQERWSHPAYWAAWVLWGRAD